MCQYFRMPHNADERWTRIPHQCFPARGRASHRSVQRLSSFRNLCLGRIFSYRVNRFFDRLDGFFDDRFNFASGLFDDVFD